MTGQKKFVSEEKLLTVNIPEGLAHANTVPDCSLMAHSKKKKKTHTLQPNARQLLDDEMKSAQAVVVFSGHPVMHFIVTVVDACWLLNVKHFVT